MKHSKVVWLWSKWSKCKRSTDNKKHCNMVLNCFFIELFIHQQFPCIYVTFCSHWLSIMGQIYPSKCHCLWFDWHSATERHKDSASSQLKSTKTCMTVRLLTRIPELYQVIEIKYEQLIFSSSQLLFRYSWARHLTPTEWMCNRKVVKRSTHAEGWILLILTSECAFSSVWKKEAQTSKEKKYWLCVIHSIKQCLKMKQNIQNEKHFNINEVKGWNGQHKDEDK